MIGTWYRHLWKSKTLNVLCLFVVICALSVLAYLSLYDASFIDLMKSHNQAVISYDERYLHEASLVTLEAVMVLGAVKDFLSMLNSTGGGISIVVVKVDVEVGQLLSSLLAAVDWSWKASLLSLISIKILEIVLQFSHMLMGIMLFGFFCMLSVLCVIREYSIKISNHLFMLSRTYMLIMVFVHWVVPGSLFVSSWSCEKLFDRHGDNYVSSMKSFHQTSRSLGNHEDLHKSVKNALKLFKEQHEQKDKHNLIPHKASTHIFENVFEFLLLPIFLFSLFYKVSRRILL